MSDFSFNLSDFLFVWWGLLYEAIPFVALGALLAGFVERCVSRETIARVFPRSRWLGLMVSGCLGLLFPMCECGVVPVVRRLLSKGVPVSCGVTYLLASPIVNPLVVLSTMIAFRSSGGWTVAGLRLGAGYVIAVLVGLAVWKWFGERDVLGPMKAAGHDDECGCHSGCSTDEEASRPRGSVIGDVLAVAASDFLQIGAALVVGAAIAAAINSGFSRDAMEPFAANPWTAVSGMMILAAILNLCSEADAFVAASFYAFPLAAKLAFLVLGPMFDIKLLVMYTAVFRTRAILFISSLVVVLVFVFSIIGYVTLPIFFPE